jgi:hypothetical protein
MKLIKRYISLIEDDKKYSVAGLIFGCTGSYYSVYANEHISKIMLGDFSKERLLLLFYSNVIVIVLETIGIFHKVDIGSPDRTPAKSLDSYMFMNYGFEAILCDIT